MKLFYFVLILFLFTNCKEEDDHSFNTVPSLVASTFQMHFPKTEKLKWEMENGDFEADFQFASIDHKALFNKKGELLKYKKDCSYSQLPESLKEVLKENFKIHQLEEIEQVTVNEKIYYQLEIEQSFTELKKIFNENGNLTKTIPFWD